MKFTTLVIALPLLGLVACGGKGGGGSDSAQSETNPAVEAADGVYHAHLRPLNPHSNGYLPHGGATFRIDGDKLSVTSYIDDASGVTHRQSVHTGTSCPTAAHDANGDGMIDYNEALKAVGPVLIPLDGDLSSQEKGAEIYPKGSSFTYNESGFVSEMVNNLYESDPVPGDEIVKLGRGQGMKLVGRVVLVHGTFSSDLLPGTLSTRGTEAANLALPVVCGVISPVL
ncbi:MAG: hypothetical protein V4598_06940 [Bdellovibrionota bacterium]